MHRVEATPRKRLRITVPYEAASSRCDVAHSSTSRHDDDNDEFYYSIELDDCVRRRRRARRKEPPPPLSRAEILDRLAQRLARVRAIIGERTLNDASIRALLSLYHWNEVRALEAYALDSSGELRQRLGLTGGAPTSDHSRQRTCPICCEREGDDDDDDPLDFTTIDGCNHSFCRECLGGSLRVQVADRAERVTCPGRDAEHDRPCRSALDDSLVLSLLDDDESARERFIDTLAERFIDSCRSLRRCTTAGCTAVLELIDDDDDDDERAQRVLECSRCSSASCARCPRADHRPASCSDAERWSASTASDEARSERLIAESSRPCPSCAAPITKNHGCLHMHCRACSFHFCWKCMDKFGSGPRGGNDGYRSHRCARRRVLELDEAEQRRGDAAAATAPERERVEALHAACDAQRQSIEFERREWLSFGARILANIRDHHDDNGRWYERAWRTLLATRRHVISATIARHARECERGSYGERFDHLLQTLENNSELLASLVESRSCDEVTRERRSIEAALERITRYRAALLDEARYC